MPRSCPVFHEADIGELGDKDWKRHIRISCPGLSEDAVDIQRVPNGVHVIITESDVDGDCHRSFGLKSRILFDKEFHYDHRVFGCLNLCEDECSFNDGVLNLVLKRSQPERLMLSIAKCKIPATRSTTNLKSNVNMIGGVASWRLRPRSVCSTAESSNPEVFAMTPEVTEDGMHAKEVEQPELKERVKLAFLPSSGLPSFVTTGSGCTVQSGTASEFVGCRSWFARRSSSKARSIQRE